MKISRLVYVCIAAFAIYACSDGEDGAMGPQGEQGIQGEPGEDGNANVRSYLFEDQEITQGYQSFSVPGITQDILDHGVVFGYFKNVTVPVDTWLTMPYNNSTNILNISRIALGESVLFSTFDTTVNLRFVVVEGEEGVSSEGMTVNEELKKAGVDISDFYEVADYYGLEY